MVEEQRKLISSLQEAAAKDRSDSEDKIDKLTSVVDMMRDQQTRLAEMVKMVSTSSPARMTSGDHS